MMVVIEGRNGGGGRGPETGKGRGGASDGNDAGVEDGAIKCGLGGCVSGPKLW